MNSGSRLSIMIDIRITYYMWRFQWIPREVVGHHSINNRNEDGVRVYITPFSSQFLLTEAKHGV